jgi:hypothetical protein
LIFVGHGSRQYSRVVNAISGGGGEKSSGLSGRALRSRCGQYSRPSE